MDLRGRPALIGRLRRGEGWAGVYGFGVGSDGGADGKGFGRDLAVSEEVEVVLENLGGFGRDFFFVGGVVGRWISLFVLGQGRQVEVAEDEFGEFFGHALFCGAVGREDVVAFGFGVGFVEEGCVVEGFAHFYIAALSSGEGGLLYVGFGVSLGCLGWELGGGLGIGVEGGVVLDALGVAEDAFGRWGCAVVILTIQGGVPRCVEEF
jgi:hypothetical protein